MCVFKKIGGPDMSGVLGDGLGRLCLGLALISWLKRVEWSLDRPICAIFQTQSFYFFTICALDKSLKTKNLFDSLDHHLPSHEWAVRAQID